ncbi:hypothetical protein SLA2020_321350 [Shorea laevis]
MASVESQRPKLSVKQISSNGTPLSHTNSDPIMLQDSHRLPRDSANSKDSSTTRSKGTRKEDKSKGSLSSSLTSKDVKSIQSPSSSTCGSLGNGSKVTREAVPAVGHLPNQRRKQHFDNGEGVVSAIGKGFNSSKGLGSGHCGQELDPTCCGTKGSRSHPVSPTPNRMDPTSPSTTSPRHVSSPRERHGARQGRDWVGSFGRNKFCLR